MRSLFGIIAGLLAALTLVIAGREAALRGERRDCLRLHILANSDSEEDQRVKLLVRDAILDRMRQWEPSSKREAQERMLLMGGELQSITEETLKANGFDYGAELIAGEFDFPERNYSGEVYPAGEYAALRVILGEGKGHNWWCVMFPPLCLIDDGGGIAHDPDGTLEFRSIILDLWRSIFG